MRTIRNTLPPFGTSGLTFPVATHIPRKTALSLILLQFPLLSQCGLKTATAARSARWCR